MNASDNLLVLRQGDEASLTKAFTAADVRTFADLSLDYNLVHLDEEHAAGTAFGQRIVHGKLVEGLVSAVLGNRLPGPQSVFRKTETTFLAPVYLDEEVTATVRVRSPGGKPNWVILDYWARVGDKLVLTGEATITLPKEGIKWA